MTKTDSKYNGLRIRIATAKTSGYWVVYD